MAVKSFSVSEWAPTPPDQPVCANKWQSRTTDRRDTRTQDATNALMGQRTQATMDYLIHVDVRT